MWIRDVNKNMLYHANTAFIQYVVIRVYFDTSICDSPIIVPIFIWCNNNSIFLLVSLNKYCTDSITLSVSAQ